MLTCEAILYFSYFSLNNKGQDKKNVNLDKYYATRANIDIYRCLRILVIKIIKI